MSLPSPPPHAPRRPEPRDERLRYQMRMLRHRLRRDEFDQQWWCARQLAWKPVFSVITPVFNTPPDVLTHMLRSVRTQTYPFWELCLVDDGSDQPWIARHLARLAQADARLRFTRCATNGGIVAASNAALAMATGDFIALLDHDDELAVDALYRVASLLNEHPEADMVYSDFDIRGMDGICTRPFFKPDWSPEYLHSLPYTTHLTVYRTELVRSLGGFRDGLDGSQDYDLALRVTEATSNIFHIPRVLYHWRQIPGSSAERVDAKPYAFGAATRAINEYIARMGIDAVREDTAYAYAHRIKRKLKTQPLVSIVVLAAPLPGLMTSAAPGPLLESVTNLVEGNAYPNLELVVIAAPGRTQQVSSDLATLRTPHARLQVVEAAGDVARALNAGAAAARGEHLLFVGEGVHAIGRDWLRDLLEYSEQPSIGAVGPKIYAAAGTVQHAGVVLLEGEPRRVHAGEHGRSLGYYGNLVLPMNYSAVSGACLMARHAVFDEVGGFEEAASVGFSDVDYCLRVRRNGYRVVFTPFAELRQAAGLPGATGNDADRVRLFRARWGRPGWADPYYNPNLSVTGPLFTFDVD